MEPTLSEIFSERECQHFGCPPQAILDSIGQIVLQSYVQCNRQIAADLQAACGFLSPAQIEAWAEIFEGKLDECFLKFEDYVYGNGILSVPKVQATVEEGDADEAALDAAIQATLAKLKTTAFVVDQLHSEMDLLAEEESKLSALEAQFAAMNMCLAEHDLSTSFERGAWQFRESTGLLQEIVSEMLDLSSQHLFSNQESVSEVAGDDVHAFALHQQRMSRELFASVSIPAVGGAGSSAYAEEWARCCAIGTVEDLAALKSLVSV